MGTVVKLGSGVDEYGIGDRVVVEVHAGCGRCERCRAGMYTACLNYGLNYDGHNKGHRANGFTTDGGFAEYAVNHVNTLVHVPEDMGEEEATLIVTAGTAMFGLDTLGGLIVGEGLVVMGPGLIGLMGVAVGKALGAAPVILTGTRDNRLELGTKLGADHVINVKKENPVEAVKRITRGKGVQYAFECSGNPDGLNDAMDMVKRGGRICLAGFPSGRTPVELGKLVGIILLFMASGEKATAPCTVLLPLWPRSGLTSSSSTPIPLSWRRCLLPSSIVVTRSIMPSRSSSRYIDA
jgi:L-iditol 2-dehydrogenase